MITEVQREAIGKAVVPVVYLVEFDFRSGTQYASTLNKNIEWNGKTWLGLGALSKISTVDETASTESSSLSFTMNVAEKGWLALAAGEVEEYRGRGAKMWMCPLDAGFNLIGEPVRCWSGIMDQVVIGIEGEEGQITLKCETSAYGLKRKPLLRMNGAQQKKRHPTDTGFDFLPSLLTQPEIMWMTKTFQKNMK